MKEKARREKARAAKRAKTQAMIAKAEKKRRWKRNVAVVRFFVKSTVATIIVCVSFCALYLFACACLKVTNMVNNGWRVARSEIAAFVEPAEADDRPHLKPALGISFAPNYETAAPMEGPGSPDHIARLIHASVEAYSPEECPIDPLDIRAIMQVESTFKPESVSDADARGLMQLNPRTRRVLGYSEADAHDVVTGIGGGVKWFAAILNEQNCNRDRAIQNYFCGRLECIGTKKGKGYLAKVNYARKNPAPQAPQIVAMNSSKHEG